MIPTSIRINRDSIQTRNQINTSDSRDSVQSMAGLDTSAVFRVRPYRRHLRHHLRNLASSSAAKCGENNAKDLVS